MIDLIVEELIYFAETHLELKDLDALYIKNFWRIRDFNS